MITVDTKLDSREIKTILSMITYVLTDNDTEEAYENKLYSLEEKMERLLSKVN